MMKRLLTYGWLLLTLLASLFVMPSCQEDEIPHDTTEVMMTFTTRAVVTQDKESDVIDVEKMDNLRVIMVREDGTIAYKEENVINGSRVTVIFNTPVKTGGENFQFFAIANEDDILPPQNLGNIQSGDIEALKNRIVGNGSEFTINNAIPQTKYWTAKVNPYESLSVSQQLDYLVSKISVQFKNETNKAQSLSNIHITGITPNGKGRLFNHPTGKKDNEGEEIYEEVYVTTNDVTLTDGKIDFGSIGVGAATNEGSTPTSSVIHYYYSYPVDKDNISSPTLHATWNNKTYELPLEGITSLKRNDHLKVIVTLTGQELEVNYTIAPWNTKNSTNIGSPTIGGGYNTEDWTAGGDVNIGGDPVVPDVPVVPGGVLWSKDNLGFVLNYSTPSQVSLSDYLDYFRAGRTFGVEFIMEEYNSSQQLFIRKYSTDGPHDGNTLPSTSGNVIDETMTCYEFVLKDEDVEAIKDQAGVSFFGGGITITKIYIKAPATQ